MTSYPIQSARGQIIERRTYQRPLDAQGTKFETTLQAWERVIDHQRWLWERAQDAPLTAEQEAELAELLELFLMRKATVSGRTRWLGGTAIARSREASQFNCAFTEVQTINDVVDTIWLLLQGCGVGFRARVGVLNGFGCNIPELEIVSSTKTLPVDENGTTISDPNTKGFPDNVERFDRDTGVWTIRVGDSAEAWAKFFGKLLAQKFPAKKLVIDFSEIRPAGYRLSGYGWISSGDSQIIMAARGIFEVMNRRACELLTALDILDIENHLGTILSSRRSAEIALYEHGGVEWKDFAVAKKDHFHFWVTVDSIPVYDTADTSGEPIGYKVKGEHFAVLDEKVKPFQIGTNEWVRNEGIFKKFAHRAMSNNSLLFYQKPTRRQLTTVFNMIEKSGGSEPGFINAVEALRRAPYFHGVNPCAEILLGDKSFCNLVETVICRFNGDEKALHRAHTVIARANYRQTCVNLDDGILQRTWHELNQFLRLCGVGVTGVVGWEFMNEPEAWQDLKAVAYAAVNGMADELGLPHPKLCTTAKPSGTQSKVAGCVGDEIGEGVHKPLGRYIFNSIRFPRTDPLVSRLTAAGYRTMDDPYSKTDILVVMPVEFTNVSFDKITRTMRYEEKVYKGDGNYDIIEEVEEVVIEVNLEPAISQLDRYKMLMDNYVDHNCSITINYDLDEVPDIIDWMISNWDSYVGVAFVYRTDPTKTAADLGYPYLPQEVVDQRTYHEYAAGLKPVDFGDTDNGEMIEVDECVGGSCPIR